MNAHTELDHRAALDGDLAHLAAHKDAWARTSVAERIAILKDIRGRVVDVAEGWAETAARKKLLPEGSPLAAEEWMSGPYALLMACDALLETLRGMEGRAYLRGLPRRYLPNGQLALGVVPASVWDKLLLNGISAEVWMQPGVSEANLAEVTAPAYAVPEADRAGKVALVLGAGNIASIPPLDCLQKLFQEHQVVLLKMNPVNDYLTDYFRAALRPLIDIGALRIVEGDGAVGAYLTDHPLVEEIHITGAGATYDAIVWGAGEAGARNKAAGTPKNTRQITSELGAVCPTIVVPGPWSREDIAYQAENLATQKLHNSGFNCIACQVLVLPKDWDQKDALLAATKKVISKNTRLAYYPGAEDRLADFGSGDVVERGDAPGLVVSPETTAAQAESEVFGPAMSLHEIAGEGEAYLREAIAY
ncbi:MAG: aldehyde dehydrogenase family protein, partial [Pseudomonadota bacterium]